MIFPVRHRFYDACVELSQREKYNGYMNLDKFINPYYYENNPVEVLRARLTNAGFFIQQVELWDRNYNYNDVKHIESKSFHSQVSI